MNKKNQNHELETEAKRTPAVQHFLETYAAGGRAAVRIRIIIFLAITLPVLAAATFSYAKTRGNFTEFASLRQQSIANLSAITVRAKFDQLTDIVRSLASDAEMLDSAASDDWTGAVRPLEAVLWSMPDLESIILTDSDGIVTASVPEIQGLIGQDVSMLGWFVDTIKKGGPHVSDVYQPLHNTNYKVISVSVPLNGKTHDMLGMLVLRLRMDTLLSWAENIEKGPDTLIFFTDRKGRVATHPLIDPENPTIADYSAFPPVIRALNLERGVEVLYDPRLGKETVVAFEPVLRYGWVAVVEQPTQTTFSLRQAETTYVLITYGYIFGLNAFLALLLISTLSSISSLRMRERAMVGSIGDGLIVTDKRGNIIRINKGAASMLGFRKEELAGKSLEEVLWVYDELGKEMIKRLDRPFVRAVNGNKVTGKYVYMTKSRSKFPVSLTATPLAHRDEISGSVVIFRDITKEEELDRAKKEFVSVASHELLTPVSASKAFLSMLLSGDLGEITGKQKVYMKKLFSLNQRMVELVDDLLNVSRLELGVLESAAEPVNVVDAVQCEVKLIKPLAESKKIEIKEEYTGGIPTMLLAPKLLRLVMQNLLSNAIKYSPDGGLVSVSVKTEKQAKGPDTILISVSDTGMGIPKDQQKKIFSKFFRAENVKVQEIAGTGLGLFIVQNIVTMFKGKIWFESEEGAGTTFFIRLPIRK